MFKNKNLFLNEKNAKARDDYAIALHTKASMNIYLRTGSKEFGAEEIMVEVRNLLLDETDYRHCFESIDELQKAINDWYPGNEYAAEDVSKCALVQLVLLSDFLEPKDKAEALNLYKLSRACEKYMLHLKDEIAQDKTFAFKLQIQLNPQTIIDEKYRLAIQKYNAVTEMLSALNNSKKESFSEKIEDFRKIYYKHKSLIETDRNTPAEKFLKNVIKVFSLGTATLFSMWKSTGSLLNNEVDNTLNTKKPGNN